MRRLTLALLALCAATPAFAQDEQRPPVSPEMHAERTHMHEVCGADIARFCPDASGDRRARHECLMANQSKFSKPCQDALGEMQARRAAHRQQDQQSPQ